MLSGPMLLSIVFAGAALCGTFVVRTQAWGSTVGLNQHDTLSFEPDSGDFRIAETDANCVPVFGGRDSLLRTAPNTYYATMAEAGTFYFSLAENCRPLKVVVAAHAVNYRALEKWQKMESLQVAKMASGATGASVAKALIPLAFLAIVL